MIRATASVKLTGIFFTVDPVGRLHRNVYSVLRDEAALGVSAARAALRAKQRTSGKGGRRGEKWPHVVLAHNIVAVPRRRRGSRMEVVVSAAYGPQPLARFYNRFVDSGVRAGAKVRRGYRFYAAGARTVQAHIDSNLGSIEQRLVEGLT